jgi:hypothetical protein
VANSFHHPWKNNDRGAPIEGYRVDEVTYTYPDGSVDVETEELPFQLPGNPKALTVDMAGKLSVPSTELDVDARAPTYHCLHNNYAPLVFAVVDLPLNECCWQLTHVLACCGSGCGS